MPPNVFLLVKKINKDKNIISFLTNTNLAHYQVFLKSLERLTTKSMLAYIT